MSFKNDQEMFDKMEKMLYTAVCCDVMDGLGYRNQAMRHDIRPIGKEYNLIGRAKTILAVDIFEVADNPYEGEIKAIDSVKPGEVVVGATNKSTVNGLWGELLSTATKVRGGRGAVIDGITRDVEKIIKLGHFPVFAVGFKPVDSAGRGKVIDFDCPIVCGDILVNPGDLIFGDYDGVIAIPKDVAEEVVMRALDKVKKENLTRDELLKGNYLADAYAKYGVL
jgi:regulator of RNase E activity RraA